MLEFDWVLNAHGARIVLSYDLLIEVIRYFSLASIHVLLDVCANLLVVLWLAQAILHICRVEGDDEDVSAERHNHTLLIISGREHSCVRQVTVFADCFVLLTFYFDLAS